MTPPSTGDRRTPGRPRPSRTSQTVALTRAGLSRPSTEEGDPDAQRRLCAGMRARSTTWLRSSLAARTRFFDEQVLGALAAGVHQVVILGAGYDDRAIRFRDPDVRYYEIDHPATQADKDRRLQAMGAATDALVLAPADFRYDDVDGVLAACGHDRSASSLFLCEGLLVYLHQATVVDLLSALRRRAGAGSVLAVSLAVHRDGIDSATVAAAGNARRRTGRSEPWRTILPAGAHLELLARAGWLPRHTVDAADLGAARRGRSLFVTAVPSTSDR